MFSSFLDSLTFGKCPVREEGVYLRQEHSNTHWKALEGIIAVPEATYNNNNDNTSEKVNPDIYALPKRSKLTPTNKQPSINQF